MLCEGVMLYMMLVTVFGNKLNKQRFFFFLGWGKPVPNEHYFKSTSKFLHICMYVLFIGPAIPIVAISVGVAHEHYGTDYYSEHV